jgi:hypothetical protein
MTIQPESAESSYEGPELQLEIGNETFTLTWRNTIMRTFPLEDGEYDHFRHELPDGKFIAFSFKAEGLEVIVEALSELNFPHYFSPTLDEPTLDWYVSLEADEVDEFEFPTQ